MKQRELPIKGFRTVRGKPRKKFPERPVLSGISISEYVPLSDKEREATRPTEKMMKQRRISWHQYQVERTRRERTLIEQHYGKSIDQLDDSERSRFRTLRKAVKEARLPAGVGIRVFDYELPDCRFRTVTIKECLTEVCVDQKEFMPIWGNWQALVAEPLTVDNGEFPAFTITDCVPADGGYTLSDGWVSIGASITLSQPTRVKEIGVNFTGTAWLDVDGEDHWWRSNEWGETTVWSTLQIRSRPASGSYTHLISGPSQKIEEISEKNEWGPTTGHNFVPSSRHISPNFDVQTGHEFLVDYTLEWEVKRSDDYWASACFGMQKLAIKPYVIYESCNWEYRQVRQFYGELSKLAAGEARARGYRLQRS